MAYVAVLLVLSSVMCACAHQRAPLSVPAVDLLRLFDHADRRPVTGAFELTEHTLAGVSRASLVVPAESRVTWTLFVPHRGRLQTFVALPETPAVSLEVRVGVADDRVYTTVAEHRVTEAATRGWVPIDVDLSMYAGWKWSLFYRPDKQKWRVILGTHVVSGSVAKVFLGAPALMTDGDGAREYLRRLGGT